MAPPSLPRVRADPVPLLHRYYEVLRFPTAPSAALRCLRTAGTTSCIWLLRSAAPQTQSPAAWSSSIRSPLRIIRVETAGRPRFLRNPRVSMPCSPTPAGPTRQALRRSRLGPRYVHNEGSHDQINLSGLHHTAWTLAAYASQSGLPQNHARLASRCWPLCGTGLVTRRIPTKGFRVVSYISSPFPKLSWRKDIVNNSVRVPARTARPVVVELRQRIEDL